MALFGLSLIATVVQGFRWRVWTFTTVMFLGYSAEIIGYGGRIILWSNSFSFPGFMVQIICLTIAPAFFSAAIYLTLSRM